MTLGDCGAYARVPLAVSRIFAMGGVGSAAALVPLFHLMGLLLDLAKAIGMFVNSASTITAPVMNMRRGPLDDKDQTNTVRRPHLTDEHSV